MPAGTRNAAESPAIGPPLDNLHLDPVVPTSGALFDVSPDEYRARGVEYIVTSSYSADAPNLDPNRDARRRAFYASLARDTQQVAQFRPYDRAEPEFVYDRIYGPFDSLDRFDQPGPTITIYRLTE